MDKIEERSVGEGIRKELEEMKESYFNESSPRCADEFKRRLTEKMEKVICDALKPFVLGIKIDEESQMVTIGIDDERVIYEALENTLEGLFDEKSESVPEGLTCWWEH